MYNFFKTLNYDTIYKVGARLVEIAFISFSLLSYGRPLSLFSLLLLVFRVCDADDDGKAKESAVLSNI